MTAIWHNNGTGWTLLAPAGFPNEEALHTLIDQAPQVLPLAGSPRLVVVGREVLLGGNYADLIAVEPSGRLAIVEIKLAKNAESRRAVVAQILTYAAYLRGMPSATLEQQVLGSHLQVRGYASLADAVALDDQAGAFETVSFAEGLEASLSSGRFRLVLVLDEAPEQLVQLVGYLQAITAGLLIDLVTVSSYNIAGSQVLVPQRVDPEHELGSQKSNETQLDQVATNKGRTVEGATDFIAMIDRAPEDQRALLRELSAWAEDLERQGLARLLTYHGTTERWTLLPYLLTDDAGLITIWNDRGAYISFWRSVFQRRAPLSLTAVERVVAPGKVGQGNVTREINDRLLSTLTEAYREAASGRILSGSTPSPPEG